MPLVPLTTACLAAAAGAYQLPQTYLYAILATEGGHVGQSVPNKNGTSDLGPFQVNSSWGPALARFWRLPTKATLDRVRNDGCANAVAASAILKGAVMEAHGDLSTALGRYHSHSPKIGEPHGERVPMFAEKLQESRE